VVRLVLEQDLVECGNHRHGSVRCVREVCREHGIAETLYYGWRGRLLEGGRGSLAGKAERTGEVELRRKVAELERALGRKTYELEIAGKAGSQSSRSG
jgi:transposase-like protein